MLRSSSGKGLGPVLIGGLILLAIAGWAGFRIFMTINPPGGRFQMPPAAVRVAPVKLQPMTRTYDTTGTVTSDAAVTLSSRNDGQVSSVLVQEGQAVSAGQPLIRLDGEEERASVIAANAVSRAEAQNVTVQSEEIHRAQSALDAANARLKQAQSEYDRFARLQRDDVISPLEFEAKQSDLEAQQAEARGAAQQLAASAARLNVQRAQVATAQANAKLAATRLGKSTISAPFSGVIGQKLVNTGSYVRRGDPLLSLTGLEPLNIRLSVPERYLPWLTEGQQATVSDSRGRSQMTRVVFIDPVVDASLRTVALKLAIAREPEARRYRPGQFLDVNLILETHANALTIPEEAVLSEAGQNFAFVVFKKAGKSITQRLPITLGLRKPGWVEVTKGLHRQDRVVVGGLQKVQDGAEVNIIP
jgi:membrane fusion protein (multidrug efflux system)